MLIKLTLESDDVTLPLGDMSLDRLPWILGDDGSSSSCMAVFCKGHKNIVIIVTVGTAIRLCAWFDQLFTNPHYRKSVIIIITCIVVIDRIFDGSLN